MPMKKYPILICIFFLISIYSYDLAYCQKNEKLTYKIIESFKSPGLSPDGLAWDGNNLFISDNKTAKIYKINIITKNVDNSFSSPVTKPGDIAWNGENLLLLDNESYKIYVINLDENNFGSIKSEINLSLIIDKQYKLGGITIINDYIFCCYEAGWSSQIIKIDINKLEKTFFAFTTGFPKGLTYDGKYLWNCADAKGSRLGWIDIYDISTGLIINSIDTQLFLPTGITFDGQYFWIADKKSNEIFKIEIIK